MSYKKYLGYRRQDEKEELYQWLEYLWLEETRELDWYDEFPNWGPDFFEYPGAVANMSEYHQRKLLTLLYLIGIRGADLILINRRW